MLIVGNLYTKKDIYETLNVPLSKRKGAWDTGYRKYNANIYIFINIGVAGRTGHNYDNHWAGKDLVWFGKTKSNVFQPLIRDMIDANCDVHIFTRTNNGDPFTYQGLGHVKAFKDVRPVKIIWQLNHEDIIDIGKAWDLFLVNAKASFNSEEVYFSPKQGYEYKVINLSDESITIKRLSVKNETEVVLTKNVFKTALQRLNASGGFIAKKGMYKKVAFETAIVWFLPMLDWDDDIKNIVLSDAPIENNKSEVPHFQEANDDTEIVSLQKQLRTRRGQNKLRENLFFLYDKKCCVTGSSIKDILHACHIVSHSTSGNNNSTNALLLRSDIHDLFDSNLLGIDPKTLKIKLKEPLRVSEYNQLDGKKISSRSDNKTPDQNSLTQRWDLFKQS